MRAAPPGPAPGPTAGARQRSYDLLRVNERRRALQVLLSAGVYQGRDLTARLQRLHNPAADGDEEAATAERGSWGALLADVPGVAPLQLRTEAWWRAIRTAPRLSAAGPTGWTYEHLQAVLRCPFPEVRAAWERVAQRVAAGRVPPCAHRWYGAAYLGGLEKPGGVGLRPVAAGEVLRRGVGRAMLWQERNASPSSSSSGARSAWGCRVGQK